MLKLQNIAAPLAILGGLSLAATAIAQDSEADPHQAMVEVFASDSMRERAFDSTMRTAFRAALEADQELLGLEIECPGLMDGLETTVRPIMWESHKNDYVVYRQDLLALFQTELTAEEASGAAGFFGSDLGQRFFDQVFAKQSHDHTVREAMESGGEEDISMEAMSKDNDRTAIRALMSLEPVDRQEIVRVFETEAWAKSFAELRPKMNALLADPKFQNFTSEEDEAIEKASTDFAIAHFDTCFAETE